MGGSSLPQLRALVPGAAAPSPGATAVPTPRLHPPLQIATVRPLPFHCDSSKTFHMQEPAYPVRTFPQGERRLSHSEGEAEKFYRGLKQRGVSVRVGMEATGYPRWFERLLAELGIEL